ncbi:hypothetical protein ACFQU9_06640 [Actinomadura namibiensis]|uniref:Uncharacterized protein n=1 Tax=Actinomadura namibiensis TaxID=182080 RepID=A0A7W3LPY8_ACTNM|nr:hypothetical protein [Actinomadura namibiensis]MBA8952144.1 hypothetical protein [Actinomadura namibiensis]
MTSAPPKHARGRHAKPSSGITARWNRWVKNASPGEAGRRRLVAAGAGTGAVALLAVAAAAALSATGADPGTNAGRAGAVAVARDTPRGAATPAPPQPAELAGDPDDVSDALPYLQRKDPDKKVTRHVKKISRSGDSIVRVYTDLEEDDENSGPAVSLCEWTTQFLADGGETSPRVFVHATSEGNGSVVVANKQSDKDDCEVGETR